MKKFTLLVVLFAFGCGKDEAPVGRDDHERAAPKKPVKPSDDKDPLDSADVSVVRHREWKIGDTDSGDFNEQANEAARQMKPLDPTRNRNVPKGLIHRYDFEVTKKGYAVALVHQHVFTDDRATPVMALFKDDGTRDKIKIPLPQRETPKAPFELEKLPSGTYEVEDGFGFVAQDLEPGPYVLLVKPAERDAFQSRLRGGDEAQKLDETTFICMSKCQFCK